MWNENTFAVLMAMASEPQVVEHFFGVYLLYCKNPTYKGRTYIGYTVNPNRRIKQHNKGKKFGGAWKTSNHGPWSMVLIVHGFPNSTSALRFEWAWQHPDQSRRLKHVPKKKSRQKTFEYNLYVLSEMLKVGPWTRLPLTLRWLDDDFALSHLNLVSPPLHMPIVYSKVITKKPNGVDKKDDKTNNVKEDATEHLKVSICDICSMRVDKEDLINCVNSDCILVSHLICLAKLFCKDDGMILPLEGTCPLCQSVVLWGDLIRKKIGCNMHYDENYESDSSDSS